MFCQQTKRVKGTETKEKLNLCVELRADKLIKEASLFHSDPRIAALCTTAKEAAYNKSCYQDFTRILAANKPETIKENKGELDNSFDAVHISKSTLYPCAIKSLTNSTKLITINNQLGHVVSDSTLEELATKMHFLF